MKVILFGATGMVGQSCLLECLVDPSVTGVLAVVRESTGRKHEKFREILHPDFTDFSPIESDLAGYDACLFCLGITSAGKTEEAYRKVTKDIALAAAQTLLKKNPFMTFVFVSGAGADSTEKGKVMWARVKGEAENALLGMPFQDVYVVRPAFIQPMQGVVSKVKIYNFFYRILGPLFPLLKRFFPKHTISSRDLARVMIRVAREGAPKKVLESSDFESLIPR